MNTPVSSPLSVLVAEERTIRTFGSVTADDIFLDVSRL